MIGGFIGKPIGGIVNDGLISATASITLDGVSLTATGALALKAELTKTLDDAALSFTGVLPLKASLTVTLDDVALSFTGAIALKAAVSVTLDDVGQDIHGGPETSITDTEVIQLPINCVLAGQQPYKFGGREWEIPAYRRSDKTAVTRSGVAKLRGAKPSFTVTTNNRGYD